MNKMVQSMKAINEKIDPAKLEALLKEHTALMDRCTPR